MGSTVGSTETPAGSRWARWLAATVPLLIMAWGGTAEHAGARQAVSTAGLAITTGQARIQGLAFSPDGKRLATGGDKRVKLWLTETGKELRALPAAAEIAALAFSPDGKQLTAVDEDSAVLVWDTETGKSRTALPAQPGKFKAFALSGDGNWLAMAGAGGGEVVDMRSGTRVSFADEADDDRRILAFGPDRRLAVASVQVSRTRLKLLSLPEAKLLWQAEKPYLGLAQVAFSPDGKHLAGAGGTHRAGTNDAELVSLWQVEGGQLVKDVYPRLATDMGGGQLYAVAYSPDGKLVAVGGSSTRIAVLDANSGKTLTVFENPSPLILALAFSPDGRWLAAGDDNGRVTIWDAGAVAKQQQ